MMRSKLLISVAIVAAFTAGMMARLSWVLPGAKSPDAPHASKGRTIAEAPSFGMPRFDVSEPKQEPKIVIEQMALVIGAVDFRSSLCAAAQAIDVPSIKDRGSHLDQYGSRTLTYPRLSSVTAGLPHSIAAWPPSYFIVEIRPAASDDLRWLTREELNWPCETVSPQLLLAGR